MVAVCPRLPGQAMSSKAPTRRSARAMVMAARWGLVEQLRLGLG